MIAVEREPSRMFDPACNAQVGVEHITWNGGPFDNQLIAGRQQAASLCKRDYDIARREQTHTGRRDIGHFGIECCSLMATQAQWPG